MSLLIDPALLPDLSRGRPVLLLAPGVAGAEALALPGLVPCGAEAAGAAGPLRLHRPGADPDTAVLPLPAPPSGLLALVAPDRARAAPLLAALAALVPDPVPLIEAGRAEAALPALAPLALAALAADRARLGEVQLALAELRAEAEATRESMVAMLQGMGYQAPPQPPRLALATEPSATGQVLAVPEGGLVVGQALGVTLEGAAALALHLAEATGDGAMLRVRLYGAESGRIFAAWAVPARAAPPGWLMLDLPAPLGPVRETACLDLRAETAAGGRLAFSLEDRIAPPDRAARVAGGGGAPVERALALRLWTAPFGRRFVLAPHWVPEEVELPLLPPEAPPGAPVRLPTQIWSAALLPEGRVERVALGAEPARVVATLGGGERCLIALPAVPTPGLDGLQAEVEVTLGEARLLEAALWLQPAGTAPGSEAELSLAAPGARWSGWRQAGPGGAPLRITLSLPPDAAAMRGVVLALRNLGTAPTDLLRVEWADLTGTRLTERLPQPPAHRARAAAPGLPSLPAEEVPQLGAVRLHEHYATPDRGYQHLDIGLEAMRLGGFAWPRLRFKFALNGDDPVLEFRSRPDWPQMFEAWPGRQADEYGPVLRLRRDDLAGAFPARLRGERDRWMLLALIRLLPTVVATAAREAVSDPADYEYWLDMARRLAGALPRG
jgi:hypothetical protein